MGDYSIIGGGGPFIQTGLTTSTLTGISVTANASANTKGGWVEMISAANNTDLIGNFSVFFRPNTGTQADFLVDIGLGEAGTEAVVIPNLYVHSNVADEGIGRFEIPLGLPTGVKISARCQASSGSAVIPVYIGMSGRSLAQSVPLHRVTAYGADTTNTDGVQVVRSTTPGNFGSWTEIVASTTNPIKGFVVGAHKDGISYADGRMLYEVGVGPSTERVIYSGMMITNNTTEAISDFFSPFIETGVASGQRLAIRAAASTNNADWDFNYVIYGVD